MLVNFAQELLHRRQERAAVAEEARLISVRTKAALTAAKARRVQLGNPQLRVGSAVLARTATVAKMAQTGTRAADVLPFVRQAQAAGATSLQQLAAALTARGIPTPSGSGTWHPASVRHVRAYAEAA